MLHQKWWKNENQAIFRQDMARGGGLGCVKGSFNLESVSENSGGECHHQDCVQWSSNSILISAF